ncbi:MAG: glycoside hydrolase family 18 protein [Cellvibrionales bacterium]|nr:glycoside hydrolase family 18 protein [Cellvibrionales bacterium]
MPFKRLHIIITVLTSVLLTESVCAGSLRFNYADDCGSNRFVGYLPHYRQVPQQLPNHLTHAIYAFVLPHPDGTLEPLPITENFLLFKRRANAIGAKVGVLVGGWNDGDDSAFETLAASLATRTQFVTSVIALLQLHDIDGVDLDWEFPSGIESGKNFTLLVNQLATALKKHDKFFSIAVPALGQHARYFSIDALSKADFVNVMAYDSGRTHHSDMVFAEESLAYWDKRKLPRAKVNLGIPFYSRPNPQSYADLVKADPKNAQRDDNGDTYWNGIPTVQAKVDLALGRVGGILVWELGQDATGKLSLGLAIDKSIEQNNAKCLFSR